MRSYRKRSIFHKYLISFASFFLVPLVALSICLQVVMYRNLSREIEVYNQNVMERLGDDLKNIHGRLMETGNQISFRVPKESRLSEINSQIQTIDLLRRENGNNVYATKIYLIYRDQNSCFSSQGVYDKQTLLSRQLRMEETEGNQFLEWLYTVEKPVYDVITKEYHQKQGDSRQQQMLFIYPAGNYAYHMDAWIVMELQESKLKLDLSTTSGKYSKGIAVLNRTGESLISRGILKLSQDDLECALKQEPESIYVTDKNENQQKMMIYSLKNPPLILVGAIDVPDLLMDVFSGNSLLLTGVLIFLVIGCVVAIYTAYHYYRPIYQLAQYMKKENEPDVETNELDYIKGQYDFVDSVRESLMKEIEKQWPLVEERLVNKILHEGTAEIRDGDIIETVFREQLKNQEYFVALIARARKEETPFLALYKQKREILKEFFGGRYSVNSSYLYDYGVIAVIFGGVVIEKEDREKVREGLEGIFGGKNTNMAFGNTYQDFSGIHLSFLEALTAVKYQIMNPNKEFHLDRTGKDKGQAYSKEISRYQTECFLILNRCMDLEEAGCIQNSVQEVVLQLEELPGQMALMCCYNIVSRLMKEMKDRGIEITENELFQLTSFSTIQDFGNQLELLMRRVCDDISRARRDTQNILMKQIKDYIEENFQDPSMCLVGMSEHFGYSSSHMSKIISQNLNQSFSELVSARRLRYTKECLLHSDRPIAQVAQEAGYGNLSNFTRRFKASENMTPGQYRSLYTKKQE
ncbi:MAG: helix-turn-helix domain-containing protein [Lachnospiraceae bacterium]|nr:helix-turn-helix domain-containing protein [Lachnospiraceae bacterium]